MADDFTKKVAYLRKIERDPSLRESEARTKLASTLTSSRKKRPGTRSTWNE